MNCETDGRATELIFNPSLPDRYILAAERSVHLPVRTSRLRGGNGQRLEARVRWLSAVSPWSLLNFSPFLQFTLQITAVGSCCVCGGTSCGFGCHWKSRRVASQHLHSTERGFLSCECSYREETWLPENIQHEACKCVQLKSFSSWSRYASSSTSSSSSILIIAITITSRKTSPAR